ncbi:MAG TPA: HEAT repeat domain-containing protein [Bacteroidales bacterium]|nr:HEAT repeat domain-containing protein [Bacteroidales bacterium]
MIESLKVSNNFILKIVVDALFIAGVLGGCLWAVLFKRTNTVPVEYILGGILAIVLVLQSLIFHYKSNNRQEGESKPIGTLLAYFSEMPFKGPVLATTLFIILSVVSFTMLDFTFLQTVGSLYKSTVSLTKFLVLFFLVTTVLSYAFKLFVYQNLIKSFKLNKAIILAPIISVIAFTAISVLLFFPMKFNFARTYSLLFLALVFTRIFVQLIRESFELYGLKMNFASQESLSRRIIDPNLFSIFNFWAFFLGGMILLILKSGEINNIHLRLGINLGVALLWLLVAIALSKAYFYSIRQFVDKLLRLDSSFDPKEASYLKGFGNNNINYLRYILNYQSYYQPHHFRKLIKQLPENLKLKLGVTLGKNNFIDEHISGIKGNNKPASNGHNSSFFDTTKVSKGYMIESLTESISRDDRIMAVRLIIESRNHKYINILRLLIRDQDEEVKRHAIAGITKFKNSDLIYEALEYVSHADYADLVCDVLTEIGPASVIPLTQTFSKPNIDLKYQSKIIKTVAQIPSDESNKFLLRNLDYPNKSIVFEAASALLKLNFRPRSYESASILKAIEKTIGNCAWLLNISYTLEREEKATQLYNNLEEEFSYTFDLLFVLLELNYGKKLIEYVKETRLERTTNEQREYGIEILNVAIDRELKPKLFPLLHNNAREEMIRLLRNEFPIFPTKPIFAIKEIINIDLGYISKLTKSSAIIALSQFQDVTLSDDVIAQLYNPEPILSEAALYSIKRAGNKDLREIELRLPEKISPKIALLSDNLDLSKYFLLNQKINHLKKLSYFVNAKGEHLLQLAEVMDGVLFHQGDFRLFDSGTDEILPLFTSPYGELRISDGAENSKRVPKDHLFGLNVYSGKLKIEALSASFIYVIKPENLTSVVLDFEDISDALFNYLNESKIQ